MRSSIFFMTALASCILPAFAQTGTNCGIVANHTVKAGESLSSIAGSANVTLDQIEFVNTQITNPRSINVGDIVKIPNSKCVAPAAKPLADPTATCSNGTAKTTTVASGDTLNIIAKEKLGITLAALLAANPQIKNPDVINVGDVINIPLCSAKAGVAGASGGTAVATKTKAAGASKTKAAGASKTKATGASKTKAADTSKINAAGASKTPKACASPTKAARIVRMKRNKWDDLI